MMPADKSTLSGRDKPRPLPKPRDPSAAKGFAFHGGAKPPFGMASRLACVSGCEIRHETDHRVANQLTMLASYVRLKSRELDEPEVITHAAMRLLTQSIEAQIHAVARLHRLLMSYDSATTVDLSPLLHEMCASFRTGAEQQHVVLVEDLTPNCWVTTDQVLPVCQLVGEAIVNSMKYAFSGSARGVVMVRTKRTGAGAVSIDIIDNGPGLPAGFAPEHDGGFGFNLMRSVGQALEAPLQVDSTPSGLRVGVALPISTLA